MEQLAIKTADMEQQQVTTTAVENTPFTLLNRDGKIQITIGRQIVTDDIFETEEEAYEYIESKPWNLICVATSITNKLFSDFMEIEKLEITKEQI